MESGLLSSDAQVASGSEDGKAYLWDLVEVKHVFLKNVGFLLEFSLLPSEYRIGRRIWGRPRYPGSPWIPRETLDTLFRGESRLREKGHDIEGKKGKGQTYGG